MKTTKLRVALVAALGLAFGSTSANAAIIDLGFSLDTSGSIGTTNFNLTRDALATALDQIPTSGANQYRVAITKFSNASNTIVAPTIVTAANIAGIKATLQATTHLGGGTCTSCAITGLYNLFNNDGGLGATTLLNITTDGFPNSQTNAEAAATTAVANGVDGISFEAVGSGITSASALANMAKIAKPDVGVVVNDINNIPNATTTGFVIKVVDFNDYEAAIKAKIGRVVDDTGGGDPNGVIPLPAGLPLLLTGFGAFGVMRLRKRKAA
ncbi:vWA domain-containing protein [Roseovarius sp. CAU 1744]|uniref:vWA domain-containing protein n=1 Tax=Roseovarius sp. CAU 1744 TaxID=3140368 RepID=UPI00325B40D5